MDNVKVGIVVVTYNRLPLLKEVISALRVQTYTQFQIIVVNNGSTDDTASWLSDQKDVYTITQENLGGAGGFFTGMKYVAEHDFTHCWIMDDDVICEPNALEELVKAYLVKDGLGFVCSKVVGIEGNPMNTPAVDNRTSDSGYACYYDQVEHGMIKVKNATFVSVFLSTEVICQIGLPYKDYFIWGDDSEYTSRISEKLDCYLACRSVVIHKRSIQGSLSFFTETNPQRLKFYYYMFRNQGHYTLKAKNISGKFKWWLHQIKALLMLLLSFDIKRFSIMLKAMLAVLSFNPSIEYPKK